MTKASENLLGILQSDLGVSPEYKHAPKRVTPGDTIETAGAVLKWYAVSPEDRPVPDEITQLARAYLARVSLEARGLGFVILHRCGNDFYFLIVCTWRGSNEIWETVFYKDGNGMVDFELFGSRTNPQADVLRLGTGACLARAAGVGEVPPVLTG